MVCQKGTNANPLNGQMLSGYTEGILDLQRKRGPSINPFSIQDKQGSPDSFLPSHILKLFLWEPEAFPGRMGNMICNPSGMFKVCLQHLLPVESAGIPLQKSPTGILTRCMNNLNWLLLTQSSFRVPSEHLSSSPYLTPLFSNREGNKFFDKMDQVLGRGLLMATRQALFECIFFGLFQYSSHVIHLN